MGCGREGGKGERGLELGSGRWEVRGGVRGGGGRGEGGGAGMYFVRVGRGSTGE